MEPSDDMKQEQEQPDAGRSTVVWRGTPRLWERCIFCELRKKCAAAGVVRGSEACADARYALAKR